MMFLKLTRLIATLILGSLLSLVSALPSYGQIDEIQEPKSSLSDEEDDLIIQVPVSGYAEFDEQEDEANTTLFFQYGRVLGVSVGAGYNGVLGNRGGLWQGGFPAIDFKLHYWFDFNFALDLGFFTASHSYAGLTLDSIDVSITYVGASLKYYFDTRDLSAALSFANPYLLASVGSFTKSETSFQQQVTDKDTKFGFGFGAGLEFTVNPKKVYFVVEGRLLVVSYADRFNTDFSTRGVPDLTGAFFTTTASLLFTF